MPVTNPRTGGCLCGAVRFEVAVADPSFAVCHCGMCRRWSAGPFFAVHCPAEGSRLIEARGLAWYQSSEWARRGFCKECGTSLFYQLVTSPDPDWIVSVEALDDPDDLTLASHIYVDAKPARYDFAGEAPRLTESELLAQLGIGPGDEGSG